MPFGFNGVGKITANVHPHVRFLFALMERTKRPNKWLARVSGIPHYRFYDWRNRQDPRLQEFEAALNAMGYCLVIRARDPEKDIAIHPDECDCRYCVKRKDQLGEPHVRP